MKFELEIKCDNAAFKSDGGEADSFATEAEVSRLLDLTSGQVVQGRSDAPLIDINGNTVGKWAFVSAPESQAAIIVGNPVDGFSLTGPFPLWGDAQEYGATHDLGGDWCVIELHPAEEG